jgi:hypothetical protein
LTAIFLYFIMVNIRYLNYINTSFFFKKDLFQFTILNNIKGGFKWGVKFPSFTGLGLGIALISTVYKNKTSPFEYVLGFCRFY